MDRFAGSPFPRTKRSDRENCAILLPRCRRCVVVQPGLVEPFSHGFPSGCSWCPGCTCIRRWSTAMETRAMCTMQSCIRCFRSRWSANLTSHTMMTPIEVSSGSRSTSSAIMGMRQIIPKLIMCSPRLRRAQPSTRFSSFPPVKRLLHRLSSASHESIRLSQSPRPFCFFRHRSPFEHHPLLFPEPILVTSRSCEAG